MIARGFIALLCLVSFAGMAQAEPVADVSVFTTRFLPVSDSNDRANAIYYLDDVDRALGEFAKGLPTNIAAAEVAARQRLNTVSGQASLQLVQAAFEGLVRAWSHDVAQLPAILINDQYLVYGVRDVEAALRVFEERVP